MLRRYLLKEILGPLAAWTAFLCLLFFIIAFLRGTDVLLGSSVTAWDVVRFTGYLVPSFLAQSLPIAFLLATLLGIGRLSEDGELKAMQALGVAPSAFFSGPVLLGAVLCVVQVVLTSTLQPWGTTEVGRLANEVIRRNVMQDVRPGVFHEELPHFMLYTMDVEPGGRWKHVLLFDNRDPSTSALAVARAGVVTPASVDRGLAIELLDGTIHRAARATDEYTTIGFGKARFIADVGEQFRLKNRFRSPREEATPAELYLSALEAEDRGEPARPWWLSLHWRLGQMLMPLAFAFLAAPLALFRRGGGRARGMLLTLGGYVAYYLLARVAVQLGENEWLPVVLAGQLANVAFVGLGLALMVALEKRGVA